ncbi:ankyrin repeat-containing protein At5g02620-like [Rhododendron vialii]|uniref:ankyrin repeat-containing protein At5g02620-like n=1 Tax=Rhododendron vialii TaxID=182163 RepID=UPI00265D7B14|nr:ankyrin repeat-containing protein At5g02620-like [Rhododendron vialii]XP_058196779.1 ankyrin repeat-containing protein At5g02620-like [Rhododendron vialii]
MENGGHHGAAIKGGGNVSREEIESKCDRAVVEKYFNWNDLHVAALNGQTAFFQIRLPLNPNLCETLDSHKRSPLHLASANGHVPIVKLLAEANPKMCLACDRDGLNPLHTAAVAGQVDVLDALFEANPCAARARVDKGERDTILHLCVKYDRLNFLEELLEKCFKGEEFVNATDHAGNTILHIAVANKKFEIIKKILENSKIDTRATNASGQTARDILLLGRGKRTKPEQWEGDIEKHLRKHHIHRGNYINHYEWIEQKRKSLTIVAILMATIAFQAGVNPPGGVWLENVDGVDGHRAGEAVMAYNHPTAYPYFIRGNTIGFVASLITITCLISGVPFRKRCLLVMLVVVMCVSITCMAFTYACAILLFTPKAKRESVDHNIVVAVVVWFGLQAILLIVHGSRLIAAENREMVSEMICRWKEKVVEMIPDFSCIKSHGGGEQSRIPTRVASTEAIV